jgi:RsiW-degrading membrane proteinase PrsW (M82 family)
MARERDRDPVAKAAGDSADLYDVSTWEERTSLDGLSVAIYKFLVGSFRVAVVLVALLILIGIGGLTAFTQPEIGVLTVFSAVPALGLAAYVWYTDVTANEPLSLLVATFLLGVLTANFAAVLNSVAQGPFQSIAIVGAPLFFYLIVGPVEEFVKLMAVRLYAFGHDSFDAVIDGAVYGAMAGLGFATIENSLYIAQQVSATNLDFGLQLITAGGEITATRALAGPGHVIYSAFAGYYLGLAKFNRENAGPIVIKGLLIAAFIHGTYNTTVGIGSGLIDLFTPLNGIWAFLAFVIVYDGLFGAFLLQKIRRYSQAYHRVHGDDEREEGDLAAEATEFE